MSRWLRTCDSPRPHEDQVIDWSLDEVTPSYFGEIEARRKNELSIKEKYVRKSLQFLIGESIRSSRSTTHSCGKCEMRVTHDG